MKKVIFTSIILLMSVSLFGQTLEKGNLIAVHVITIDLKPGVHMADFQKFHLNRLIPEYEKNYPGWQLFLVQGIRGEFQNRYGWIIIVESEEVRDQYYNDDGSVTEFGKAAAEKMTPVLEEAEQFGKLNRTYTDWLIL